MSEIVIYIWLRVLNGKSTVLGLRVWENIVRQQCYFFFSYSWATALYNIKNFMNHQFKWHSPGDAILPSTLNNLMNTETWLYEQMNRNLLGYTLLQYSYGFSLIFMWASHEMFASFDFSFTTTGVNIFRLQQHGYLIFIETFPFWCPTFHSSFFQNHFGFRK